MKLNLEEERIIEGLPDYIAETIDIIQAIPKEERAQVVPRAALLADYAKALAELLK